MRLKHQKREAKKLKQQQVKALEIEASNGVSIKTEGAAGDASSAIEPVVTTSTVNDQAAIDMDYDSDDSEDDDDYCPGGSDEEGSASDDDSGSDDSDDSEDSEDDGDDQYSGQSSSSGTNLKRDYPEDSGVVDSGVADTAIYSSDYDSSDSDNYVDESDDESDAKGGNTQGRKVVSKCIDSGNIVNVKRRRMNQENSAHTNSNGLLVQ